MYRRTKRTKTRFQREGAIMKRIVNGLAMLLAGGLLAVFAMSCSDGEQALGLNEDQRLQVHSTLATGADGLVPLEEGVIFIVLPGMRYVRVIDDPWISGAVLSMLPDAVRGQFNAKGVVYVDDGETAAAIAIIAGVVGSYASDGVWIASNESWSCLKCCVDEHPCCTPCPSCCSKKDDDKDMYYIKVEEAQ